MFVLHHKQRQVPALVIVFNPLVVFPKSSCDVHLLRRPCPTKRKKGQEPGNVCSTPQTMPGSCPCNIMQLLV